MLYKESILKFIEHLKSKEYAEHTITGYESTLQVFNRYLESLFNGPVYTDDVTKETILGYFKEKKSKGCVAATRNRILFVLRSHFSFLTGEKLLDYNPAEEIKPVRARRKERTFLTKEEVEDLVEAVDHPVIRCLVWTAYYTGLRPSELLNLTFQDVDLEAAIVHVRQGKGNKDRDIPISTDLKDILVDYLEKYRPDVQSEKIFATAQSGGLSLQYLNRKIDEAVSSLGWKKEVSAHILRHSFASRLVAKDVNLYKIQRLMGHSNINTTAVYTHSNMEELSDAVKKL